MAYGNVPPMAPPSVNWAFQPAPMPPRRPAVQVAQTGGMMAGPYTAPPLAGALTLPLPGTDYGSENGIGKSQSYGARAASLPPPVVPRRLPRRRTQEARDIIAMQNLLPQLLNDGDNHHSKRPAIEPTSSYVNEDPSTPASDVSSEVDVSSAGPAWSAPAVDHPLTAAESADMLERVQHDLLGMDITKLKGPLAEIARKNVVMQPPMPAFNPQQAIRQPAPPSFSSSAEAMTVSPKEAFLDYDQKLGSLSPSPKARERFNSLGSPMPSLFAPLAVPVTASTGLVGPSSSVVSVKDEAQSPPFGGSVASQPLIRGQSSPAPRSPNPQERAYPIRRSMEPEAAPRNAVRWVSAKREPSGLMQMLQPDDGSFDWSPSSEEGDGGLPLENPPTPPQPAAMVTETQSKPLPHMDISQLYGSHPLSADLAYIHQVPEAPTFQLPEGPIFPGQSMYPSTSAAAVSMPTSSASTTRPMSIELPPRMTPAAATARSRSTRNRNKKERQSSLPPPTPATESSERSTLDEDDDDSRGEEDEWTPHATYRSSTTVTAQSPNSTRSITAASPSMSMKSESNKREASTVAATSTAIATDDDDDQEEEDEYMESSDEEFDRPAKKSKTNKGAAKPTAVRSRRPSAGGKSGDGHIICDFVDPATGSACNTAFRRPYDLARHKESKHAQGNNKPQWICDTCSHSFSRKDALMRHARLRNHKAQ